MRRTLARITGPTGTWQEISAAHVPRRVVRALGVSPTDTEYLLPIAFDPTVFDPDESMMRTLAKIRASGLTDPVVWTTWFSLRRRTGLRAQQWLTASPLRSWNDVSWRSTGTGPAVLYSSYPDGDGLTVTAWGPRARHLLDEIADEWPQSSVGMEDRLG